MWESMSAFLLGLLSGFVPDCFHPAIPIASAVHHRHLPRLCIQAYAHRRHVLACASGHLFRSLTVRGLWCSGHDGGEAMYKTQALKCSSLQHVVRYTAAGTYSR